jgi:hypothetical protein
MRLDFDHKTPLSEQFTRAGNRKKVGRKHDKRLGPTHYGARQDGQRKFRRLLDAKWERVKAEVRKYWRGERAEHP